MSSARSRGRWPVPAPAVVPCAVVLALAMAVCVAPLLVAVGWLDPWTPHQDQLDEFGLPREGATGQHWLGVEPGLGRDVLARLWLGSAVSLGIAAAATVLAVTLGVLVGVAGGLRGGWLDALLGRLVDLTLAFPQLLMLLALNLVAVAFLVEVVGVPEGNPARAFHLVLVLGLFSWPGVARVVRSQVVVLRESEFVAAARAFGASDLRIAVREVLPNLRSVVVVQATLALPAFVAAEAALSYLGVGIRPPLPTLGNLLEDALAHAESAPLYFFAPAVTVAVVVLALNLAGDALRDAFDLRPGVLR